MKKILAIFLCILLLTGCAQVYEGPTETVYVLSETNRTITVFGGEFINEERTVYAYDIYGRVAQTMEYWNGEENRKTVNTYDERGNLIRVEYYSLGGWFPKRYHTTEHTYDEQDRCIATVEDDNDQRFETRYTYDDETNSRTTYGQDSVMVETFDENGHLLRKEVQDSEGYFLAEYTRRPDGAPLTERVLETDGREYTNYYEYDEYGECIAHIQEENGVRTETYRCVHEYDTQGRKIRTIELTDGTRVVLGSWVYDDIERTKTFYDEGSKDMMLRYDAEGREIERLDYDSKTGEVAIRTTRTYRPIQVPATGEEEP